MLDCRKKKMLFVARLAWNPTTWKKIVFEKSSISFHVVSRPSSRPLRTFHKPIFSIFCVAKIVLSSNQNQSTKKMILYRTWLISHCESFKSTQKGLILIVLNGGRKCSIRSTDHLVSSRFVLPAQSRADPGGDRQTCSICCVLSLRDG